MSTTVDNPSEFEALDPTGQQLKLSNGSIVIVERLRARQFFKLLRIITHGALPLIGSGDLLRLQPGEDADALGSKLLAMTVMAIPDAEDEAIDFIKAMVKPVGLVDKPSIAMNKRDREYNAALWATLDVDLDNPELEDMVSIIEAVIKREADDLVALGKRLTTMLNLAERTGQLPASLNPQQASTVASSEDSVEPSTSSSPSIVTLTTNALNSPSVESDKTSLPSVSDNGTETSPPLS